MYAASGQGPDRRKRVLDQSEVKRGEMKAQEPAGGPKGVMRGEEGLKGRWSGMGRQVGPSAQLAC